MSLLTILEDVCDRIGLSRPTAVIGSSDHQVRQLLSLSNQIGKHLLGRHDWQRLTTEKTFTATATETQTGALPADFERIIPGTFWNRTQDRRVTGPVSPQKWQQLASGLVTQPWDSFRIRGNALLMSPVPVAGDAMAYEYISSYWCMSVGETTGDQAAWLVDTDTSVWSDEIFTLGVTWRYQKSRGLEYAETLRDFEMELARLIGNDGGISDISLTSNAADTLYEPYVQDGSWSLT